MCGIVGYISSNTSTHNEQIDNMLAAIAKRGPDGNNKWESKNVCLGHARLSIIDLEHSSQPLCNEDGTLWITFNGEIYNYKELRDLLISKGHIFKTSGDTEVLVHLYEEFGTEMTSHIDGMFALAIYDTKKHELYAARDKVGIKPFYYWHKNGELVFGSSMEAILSNTNIERKLNYKGLGQYLHFGYTIPPLSFIESVAQLKPGQHLIWKAGELQLTQYFKWQYNPDNSKTKDQWRDELLSTLEHSVYSQLVAADVKVGSFLSGGIDSTTVSGIAQKMLKNDDADLSTYTVKVWDKDLDESSRASSIAQDLKTDHHEVHASKIPFNDKSIEDIIRACGEPFADTSSLNVLLLTKEVSKDIKVALSGDGGDEIFFGYSGYKKQQFVRKIKRTIPLPIRKMLELFTRNKKSTILRRINKYCNLSFLSGPGLIIEWSKRWHDEDRDLIISSELDRKMHNNKELFPEVVAEIADTTTGDYLEEYVNYHMKIDLSSDCLYKVDRMSMENSLEVRVPVLSDSMINLSMHMPFEYRTSKQSKELLIDIASQMSPTILTPSPKKGFSFPIPSWIKDGIEDIWKKWDITVTLERYGFNVDGIKKIFDKYAKAIEQNNEYEYNYLSMRLFDLLLLGIWLKSYKIQA